jgi:hypothetical protein
MQEVVGLFESRDQAERAADALYSRGYETENIGYLNRPRDGSDNVILDEGYSADHDGDMGEETAKGVGGGMVGGAATGAGAALLASADLLAIPGVGPFLAAGTIAGTLAATAVGAAGGAVVGGAAGAIVGATDDHDVDETSSYYRDRIDKGYATISVTVPEESSDEVAAALRDAGADRVEVYADTGWVR